MIIFYSTFHPVTFLKSGCAIVIRTTGLLTLCWGSDLSTLNDMFRTLLRAEFDRIVASERLSPSTHIFIG